MNDTIETKNLYRKEGVANAFDEERERFVHQKYKHKIEARFLTKALKSFSNQDLKILDVACGTGRMVPEIFKINKNIKYTGIDTSDVMVNKLRKKARLLEGKNSINLIIGDASSMPFEDNSFDVAYSYHLLWHLDIGDQHKIISEMMRVVKKNGIVIFDVLNKNFIWEKIKTIFGKKSKGLNKLSISEISKILGKRGKIIKIEKLSDARINNNFLYGIFNIVNKLRRILPLCFFHMFYVAVKK